MFEAFTQYLRLFHPVTQADSAILYKALFYRKVVRGNYLLQQGRTSKELLFVCQGLLCTVSTAEGSECIQAFIEENQLVANPDKLLFLLRQLEGRGRVPAG